MRRGHPVRPGVSNLSLSLADGAGGFLDDLLRPAWGPRAAFDLLVALGAAFTAGCWLLVPVLRRGDRAAAAETGPAAGGTRVLSPGTAAGQ